MTDEKATIFVLKKALEKLEIYRDHSDGHYNGGMEHTMLIKLITGHIDILKATDKNGTGD